MSKNHEYRNLSNQINFAKYKLRGIIALLGNMESERQIIPSEIKKELWKASKILHSVVGAWDEIQAENRKRLRNMYK